MINCHNSLDVLEKDKPGMPRPGGNEQRLFKKSVSRGRFLTITSVHHTERHFTRTGHDRHPPDYSMAV